MTTEASTMSWRERARSLRTWLMHDSDHKPSTPALHGRLRKTALQRLHQLEQPGLTQAQASQIAQELIHLMQGQSEAVLQDLVQHMAQRQFANVASFATSGAALDHPGTGLLMRIAAATSGPQFLVQLRQIMGNLLDEHHQQHQSLQALDQALGAAFNIWFDPGFLEMRQLTWDSPASLLEKLMRYEAVHPMQGWEDLRDRLDADRRVYAFFHPRLPQEPLIFVEVALLPSMPQGIQQVLDRCAHTLPTERARCAIFYSISNTQKGLRGVSFGNDLLKRVIAQLLQELPHVTQFATLSPIPGFASWLSKQLKRTNSSVPSMPLPVSRLLNQHQLELSQLTEDGIPEPSLLQQIRPVLQALCAHYLACEQRNEQPLDSVARFHLSNGAKIGRLNWLADGSPRGLSQSLGMMVNYQYDPHAPTKAPDFTNGVAMSAQFRALLP